MAHPDFEEFLACLNASGDRYLIIGAHAVALHVRPRATKDLDVFIDRAAANASRVIAAIRAFTGTDFARLPFTPSPRGKGRAPGTHVV